MLAETLFLGSPVNLVRNCEKPVIQEKELISLGNLYLSHQRNRMIFSRVFEFCLVQSYRYCHHKEKCDGVSEADTQVVCNAMIHFL